MVWGDVLLASSLRTRARRLLAFLLLHLHRPLARQRIAFSLWPDVAEATALGNLRRALSELRRSLPAGRAPRILETGEGLQWNLDAPCWLDVRQFETLMAEGTPVSLHDAVALYTGDLLAQWDETWLVPERERLRRLQLNGLSRLAAHHRALGEFAVGQGLIRQALEMEPLTEDLHRQRMALLYLAGDRVGAIEAYEGLRDLLGRELGVEPMAETEALRQAILEGRMLADAPSLRTVPAPQGFQDHPLGREAEAKVLQALWEEAAGGRGRLALLGGEAGVGKSHLVRHFAQQVNRQGGLALMAECYEFEQSLPFQGLVEMLGPVANLLRNTDLAPVHRAALAHLSPELLGATSGPPRSPDGPPSRQRGRLFEALFQAVQALARHQPILLLVEDAHWASGSTLDWLLYISSRLQARRVLVVVTYRTDELGLTHGLARLARRQGRAGAVVQVPLWPLSKAAHRALVAALSGLPAQQADPLADRLFADSLGNPFFLHELIRGLLENGDLTYQGGRWRGPFVDSHGEADVPLPDTLRGAILARVERLTEAARMFLRVAAVAGRIFPYEVVREAGGWREEIALAALEELLLRGFLRQADGQAEIAFTHHLVREVVYDDLPVPRRRAIHRRMAAATQWRRSADVARLLHHILAAGGSAEAYRLALRAAKRAEEAYDYAEAARYRQLALDLIEGQPPSMARLRLVEALGSDYRLLREGAKALVYYKAALELWRDLGQGDQAMLFRLYRKILQTTAGMWGRAAFEDFEPASRLSAQVRSELEPLLPHLEQEPVHVESARLLRALASDALGTRFPPDSEEAMRHAQAAVNAAERLGDPVEVARALNTLASVYGAKGMPRERLEVARRQHELTLSPDFENPRERLRALSHLGAALVHAGEFDHAHPYLRQAWDLAGQLHAVDLQAQALSLMHLCWFRLDRWEDILQSDDQRWRHLRRHHSLERLGSPCFSIGLSAAVHAHRGDLERAHRLRLESNEIMTGLSGPAERWLRNQHY